ncbi:helix-turn-helix transcriptional regulator [Rhizobium calliandrae]|uniref:Helix-turn-helix transcriptional regulator n=1 Tax=Rhizobium calliandrae TaxID=1312182 RepID=A0ABT7KC05_9HYPH|nr:helix-turn-helix transcriptional regulator [Rhizobium calliandrae]MDL2405545.1 helix-turn-helix transcriptional regulator [Rhizobium calliandrae]
MVAKSPLLLAPPYPVEQSLKVLGANLRTARLRRNLTAAEVGEKIGVDRGVVSNAEKGKPSTTIAVYAALLWAYGLTEQLSQVADPESDQEGKALERTRAPRRSRQETSLDDNF